MFLLKELFNLFLFSLFIFLHVALSISSASAQGTTEKASTTAILTAAENFTLRVHSTVKIPYSDDRYGSSTAAAFLVDKKRGILLTNAHVSRRSPAKIKVSFKNTKRIKATQAYIDTRLDLAILTINPTDIPERAVEARLNCKDKVEIGTEVAAFGHPWKLDFTATRGIVSGQRYRSDSEFIQTDTPLNPGNSGGALIALSDGKVIGINASGIKSKNSEGMGFAVPAAHACKILELFKLGVDPSPPLIPIEFAHDTSLGRFLVVARVLDNSWREKLQVGDILQSVEGNKIKNLAELETHLRGAGATALFAVKRGGQEINVNLPIRKLPLITGRRGPLISGALIFKSVYRDAYQRNPFNLFQVHGIDTGSDAESAGFREFDLLVSINNKEVKKLSDIDRLILPGEQNTFIVRRYSPSKSRLYDFKILRIHSPKISELRFTNRIALLASLNDTAITHIQDFYLLKRAVILGKPGYSYNNMHAVIRGPVENSYKLINPLVKGGFKSGRSKFYVYTDHIY